MPLSSYPLGKNPFAYLIQWIKTDWKYGLQQGWVTAFERLQDALQRKNEVTAGGIVTDGTATTTEMMCNVGAIDCVLNGRIKAQIAAITDDDLLDDATPGVEQPIFADGSDASALTLGANETAYVTLIVCNSDGAGAADDDDNGTAVILAVVAGTAATYAAQTAHLTSAEVQSALDDSTSVHDGITGWAHLAQCLYDQNGGSVVVSPIVMNRNNTVSDA